MVGYSKERAIQILISILKGNRIKKVIVSPGSTNMSLVVSMDNDGFFEMYSCPNEKDAAYMAVGLSAESGEPVVLSCTGATASREYLPALTEAYYRKLPIIAVTSTRSLVNVDNLMPQVIDRSMHPKDTVRYSVHIPFVRGATDEWDCNLKINRAIQMAFRDGGGPVQIDLTANPAYTTDYSVSILPDTRVIETITSAGTLPNIPNGKIIIAVGTHKAWDIELIKYVELFCERYNAAVVVDHSSGYKGKYRLQPTILTAQEGVDLSELVPDLTIQIGEHTGDYYTFAFLHNSKEVWRISEDGDIKDTFRKLTKVFYMPELYFFEQYCTDKFSRSKTSGYFELFYAKIHSLYKKIPKLPFSNIYLASVMADRIPPSSRIHFGLGNSLRAWTFFELPLSTYASANTGTRGIDGCVSTLIGASFADSSRLYFGVFGDLTFFYDMNILGNRHINSNVRIIVANNNGGTEFHLYQHWGKKALGEHVGKYVAADGHHSGKSRNVIRHYAEDMGFEYFSAMDEKDLERNMCNFLNPAVSDKPMIMEMFFEHEKESEALKMIRRLV